ncbi:hypothetical protein ACQ4LE_004894 [Meloidogyne hapla]
MNIKKVIKLPNELVFEIITLIPFHRKWQKIRISKLFDILVLKLQKFFIISLNFLKTEALNIIAKILKKLKILESSAKKDQNILKLEGLKQLNPLWNILFKLLVGIANGLQIGDFSKQIRSVKWPVDDVKKEGFPWWNSDHKDKHDLILLLIGLLKDAISSYSGDVNDFREVIGRLKGLLESVQTMVDTFLTYCSKAELKRYKRDDDDEDQSGPSTSKKIC